MHRFFIAFSLLSFSLLAGAQTSPNGKIRVVPSDMDLTVEYKSDKDWQTVMSISTHATQARLEDSDVFPVDYNMVVGKKSHCTNAFREEAYTTADLKEAVFVRVYNDGVAFKADNPNKVKVYVPCKNNWLQKWTDPYEEFFPMNRETEQGERFAYPALFEYDKNVFALLSESYLMRDNAATSMYRTSIKNQFELRPDGAEKGGWQTFIIGSLSDVVESTLITDNSGDNALGDVSWVKPGVASWIYWAYNHGSNDFSIIKKYVDMAVELNLPYVLIDAEWDEMDKIAANEGKTIEDAVKYANDKGVKPIIWYNSSVGWVNGAPGPKFRLNKPEDREKEFAWCEKIGVKGVKIDFMDRQDQWMVNFYERVAKEAAKHHIMVDFHGAYHPSGMKYKYPNVLTFEGVRGLEMNGSCTPENTVYLPFIRNSVGPMDFTPGAMIAYQPKAHKGGRPICTVVGTKCYSLAHFVLFETNLQMLADNPTLYYRNDECTRFITSVPTTWDSSVVLSAEAGKYLVEAKRKGNQWFLGGMMGPDPREGRDITVRFDFLTDEAPHTLTLFEDGINAFQQAMDYRRREVTVRKGDTLTLHMAPNGGFAARID